MTGILRRCTICKQVLPVETFSKNGSRNDGLSDACKSCMCIMKRNWSAKHGIPPYTESKLCSQYLGIHVAERLLSCVFQNVQRMPLHNHGYDFICGKGFKVDVKSSCLRVREGHKDNWGFNIKFNIIADYFACLAFDTRKDLHPLHFWLIPGDLICTRKGITISNTGADISKWLQYEQSLNKVIEGCNLLRVAV